MTLLTAVNSNGLYFMLSLLLVVKLLTKLSNNLFLLPAQVDPILSFKFPAKATSIQLASCLFLLAKPEVVIFIIQVGFSKL
jgi:hypothetical protein